MILPQKIPHQLQNPKRFIRCINKYTFDYIDLPIAPGQGEDVRQHILKSAYSWTWSNISSENEKPEYHYYATYSLDEEIGRFGLWCPNLDGKVDSLTPIKIVDGKLCNMCIFSVDLTTNKIIEDDLTKKILDFMDLESIYDLITEERYL
jgi:hypothetical protein